MPLKYCVDYRSRSSLFANPCPADGRPSFLTAVPMQAVASTICGPARWRA